MQQGIEEIEIVQWDTELESRPTGGAVKLLPTGEAIGVKGPRPLRPTGGAEHCSRWQSQTGQGAPPLVQLDIEPESRPTGGALKLLPTGEAIGVKGPRPLPLVHYFEGVGVRVVMRGAEPWWVAADVCEALELSNPSEAIKPLDDDEKGSLRISEGTSPKGGNPNVTVISESGLYTLILRSNKPEAKQFRKWVTTEVLPNIRKYSMYSSQAKIDELLANPDAWIQTLSTLKKERAEKQALSAQIESERPKIIFAESVTASHTSILVGELAKLLRQNGVDVGQNRLFERLRNEGYLMNKGSSYNMPTQRSMELGLFEIKETTINRPDGGIDIKKTPKVTGRGQVYFVNKFIKNSSVEKD